MVVVECEQDMKGDIIELKRERREERGERATEIEREYVVAVGVRDQEI